jgi:hypothetical protein
MKQIFVIALLAMMIGCSNKEQEQRTQVFDAIEKNKRDFDPNFNSDTTRPKLFLTFKVENKQIVALPTRLELVTGPMPYNAGQGKFKITLKDSARREIGSYYIENPLLLRSCDDTGKPALSSVVNGEFYVQIPYTTSVMFLDMRDEENRELRPVEINIAELLQRQK